MSILIGTIASLLAPYAWDAIENILGGVVTSLEQRIGIQPSEETDEEEEA